jgi:hypothetical protein
MGVMVCNVSAVRDQNVIANTDPIRTANCTCEVRPAADFNLRTLSLENNGTNKVRIIARNQHRPFLPHNMGKIRYASLS